jgi:hypothetical protein
LRSSVLLGEDLFDRVQVGRGFWQEDRSGAGRADGLADSLTLVAAEIVEDDDIAGLESGDEDALDIGTDSSALIGPSHRHGLDAVMAQRGQVGCRLPMAVRDLTDEPSGAGRLRHRLGR